jgi:hypothetical protein
VCAGTPGTKFKYFSRENASQILCMFYAERTKKKNRRRIAEISRGSEKASAVERKFELLQPEHDTTTTRNSVSTMQPFNYS